MLPTAVLAILFSCRDGKGRNETEIVEVECASLARPGDQKKDSVEREGAQYGAHDGAVDGCCESSRSDLQLEFVPPDGTGHHRCGFAHPRSVPDVCCRI